ncbi:MAG: hypothetical protein IIW11_07170 [Bacteroidales bacterium]|nr:hypothetical protein [Bacteroidales bacterium]
MRVAVLDLGTNVFNMLLAEFTQEGCKYIKVDKCASRLGGGGLSKGYIAQEAFKSGADAMEYLLGSINESGGADMILPYATSAVRDASNGEEFAQFLNEKFGIKVNIISGSQEAEYIFNGIMESVEYLIGADGKFKGGENALMLDIGGGSNEFIISDGANVLWKKSFPIGMARMREKFNYTDPITKDVMENFIEFNKGVLVELWEMVERYKPTLFIGSSGSFDTFRDLLFEEPHTASPSIEIPKQMLERLNDKLVVSTAQERLEMPRMSPIRVDYIVLASVFVQYVLQTLNPRIVVQSSYCLKEGAMRVKYKEYLK